MNSKDWDKIAKDYFEHISSPFEKESKSPLAKEIQKIKNRNKKIVLDAGCGTGNLIPMLAKEFGEIVAFDFSKEMVNLSKSKCRDLKNVSITQKDMTNLSEFKDKFDYVFTINSAIMPSTTKVEKALSQLHNSLKSGGKLIGVFPALESALYESMIIHDEMLRKHDEKKAATMTKVFVGKQYYDFFTGMIDIDGKQKHYYEFEVEYRLRKAGFKNIRISKVLYPWKNTRIIPKNLSHIDFDMWDWFVVAER